MLLILSPAKTMKPVPTGTNDIATEPEFLTEAAYITGLLKQLTPAELARLMQTSHKLTLETIEKLARWNDRPGAGEGSRALLTYSGEVYNGLSARKFNRENLLFAQKHLRVLSAVYGVLRPLDLIQPYRLEMQARLANRSGHDLYAFWRPLITEALGRSLRQSGEQVLVNLASQEYYSATDAGRLGCRIVTPKFLQENGTGYRMVTVYAKRARGLMCRFIIENRIEKVAHLKLFDLEGYLFNPDLSAKDEWVFTR
ncbi:MAG: peroxide stress protein YaaA [Bacteroidota bacterium]